MTPSRDVFMAKLVAEKLRRTKERFIMRKAVGNIWYGYRNYLFNRTVKQRKRGL